MTGAQAIAKFFVHKKIREIFGIPGNQLNELLMALNKTDIQFVVARHESGASLMAEGYSRVSGKIGVCMTIPGSGVSNAYTGILEAYNNSTPVLLLTVYQKSVIKTQDYRTLFHGLDHQKALKPITGLQIRIENTASLIANLEKAFLFLESERPSPVLLELDADLFTQEIEWADPAMETLEEYKPPVDDYAKEQIKKAVSRIRQSKFPIILAGEGVRLARASDRLLEFAKKIHAPVTTVTLGKGAISEYEDVALGSITDRLSTNPNILKMLNRSDVCIAVGVRFTQIDTENWSLPITAPIIHIDADKGVMNKEYPCAIPIACSIREVLGEFMNNLLDGYRSQWGDLIQQAKTEIDKYPPTRLLTAVSKSLRADSVLVADINIDADYALSQYKAKSPWDFLFPGTSLTLGFSIPEAIGAAFAKPDAHIVVLCGDGGFIMSSPEVATILKYHLKIVVIIVNDNAYGTIKYKQLKRYGKCSGVDLYNPDFMEFAKAYGAMGVRIQTLDGFSERLSDLLRLEEPVFVECPKACLNNDQN